MLKYSHEYGKNLTYYNVGCLCSALRFMGAIRSNGSVPLSLIVSCVIRAEFPRKNQPNRTLRHLAESTNFVTQELSCTAGSPNLRPVSIWSLRSLRSLEKNVQQLLRLCEDHFLAIVTITAILCKPVYMETAERSKSQRPLNFLVAIVANIWKPAFSDSTTSKLECSLGAQWSIGTGIGWIFLFVVWKRKCLHKWWEPKAGPVATKEMKANLHELSEIIDSVNLNPSWNRIKVSFILPPKSSLACTSLLCVCFDWLWSHARFTEFLVSLVENYGNRDWIA